MRRTKEWWARLDKEERSYLVYLEKRANRYGGMGGYIPDDCSECTACGLPMTGSGMCLSCWKELDKLIKKASRDDHHPKDGTKVTSQPDPGRA